MESITELRHFKFQLTGEPCNGMRSGEARKRYLAIPAKSSANAALLICLSRACWDSGGLRLESRNGLPETKQAARPVGKGWQRRPAFPLPPCIKTGFRLELHSPFSGSPPKL
ncbi:hypothetical protein A7P96_05280 [Eikenella sp. NML03-A-027]|nr:hypothetical protein A7P96_05280 [Eikenella sp. NML03-A-027]